MTTGTYNRVTSIFIVYKQLFSNIDSFSFMSNACQKLEHTSHVDASTAQDNVLENSSALPNLNQGELVLKGI